MVKHYDLVEAPFVRVARVAREKTCIGCGKVLSPYGGAGNAVCQRCVDWLHQKRQSERNG